MKARKDALFLFSRVPLLRLFLSFFITGHTSFTVMANGLNCSVRLSLHEPRVSFHLVQDTPFPVFSRGPTPFLKLRDPLDIQRLFSFSQGPAPSSSLSSFKFSQARSPF